MTELRANPTGPDQFALSLGAHEGAVWLLRMIAPDGEELTAVFSPEAGVGPGGIADGFAQHGFKIIHMIEMPAKRKQGGSTH